MPSSDDIQARLQQILVELFELDPQELVPEARLYEDLDLDSIDAVDLVVRLQEMTGEKINIEEYRSIRTVADLTEVITRIARDDK